MKVITTTSWRRPHMYQQMLDALAKCDGIENYTILNVMDKDVAQPYAAKFHEEVIKKHKLAKQIITFPTEVNLGCCRNTWRAWKLGFEHADDFCIYLEDDDLVSADYLRYMEFCNERFRYDDDVFCAVGYNRRLEANIEQEIGLVGKRKSPRTYLAWGTWRRIWNELEHDWFGIHWAPGYKHPDDNALAPEGEEFLKVTVQHRDERFGDGSWGYPLLKWFPKGRKEVYPLISRCQNIGAVMGRFNSSPEWHRQWIHTPIFAGDLKATEFQFNE
jgi:hypothetical protein